MVSMFSNTDVVETSRLLNVANKQKERKTFLGQRLAKHSFYVMIHYVIQQNFKIITFHLSPAQYT